MSALYKQAFEEMVAKYEKEFGEFSQVHDKFGQDQEKWKEEFDRLGKPVLRIVTEAENRLCRKSENSGYGKYSASLSEKFWGAVRQKFPLVDLIGVTIQ